MISLHRVRIWDSRSGRMRSSWTLKPQMMIGSDPKADLKLPQLKAFELRLDFIALSVDRLAEGSRSTLSASGLVEIPPYHLHVRSYPLRGRHLISAVSLGLVLAGIFGLSAWRANSTALPPCEVRQLNSERQEIKRIQSNFRRLLKEGAFPPAQGELLSLKRLNLNLETFQKCQIRKLVSLMEGSLRRERFYGDLKAGQLQSALNLLLEAEGAERDVWERQFLSSLREKYLEAYRTEEEEPLESAERFSEIQELCQKLRGQSFCFRDQVPNTQEKSRP